jgi:hypothetical protein
VCIRLGECVCVCVCARVCVNACGCVRARARVHACVQVRASLCVRVHVRVRVRVRFVLLFACVFSFFRSQFVQGCRGRHWWLLLLILLLVVVVVLLPPPLPLLPLEQVAVGPAHSMVVDSDGLLWGCGYNRNGVRLLLMRTCGENVSAP